MRAFLFCLAISLLILSPPVNPAEMAKNCARLLASVPNVSLGIKSARRLETIAEKHLGGNLDGLLALDLLWSSIELGASQEWIPLKEIRDRAGVDVTHSTAKRIMRLFYQNGYWVAKEDPVLRNQKLIQPTEAAIEILNTIMQEFAISEI